MARLPWQGHDAGVGIALRRDDATIIQIGEYREIDYLTDRIAPLPDSLHEPAPSATLAPRWARSTRRPWWPSSRRSRCRISTTRRGTPRGGVGAPPRGDCRTGAAHHEAGAELEAAQIAREAHPCHTCPVRKEHRRNQRDRDRLERERAQLMEALERQSTAEERRIRYVIRGILDVLHRFSYMRQGYPTPKADMLADVFYNDGLILCEMIDRDLLDPLTPDEIADDFTWNSFDRDYRSPKHDTLPPRLVYLRDKLEDLERDIIGEERDHKLFISEGHNPNFYGAARAWCQGDSMAEIGDALELSEGDLVITFNKTIDLLRQVREMLIDVRSEHPLLPKLDEAIRRLKAASSPSRWRSLHTDRELERTPTTMTSCRNRRTTTRTGDDERLHEDRLAGFRAAATAPSRSWRRAVTHSASHGCDNAGRTVRPRTCSTRWPYQQPLVASAGSRSKSPPGQQRLRGPWRDEVLLSLRGRSFADHRVVPLGGGTSPTSRTWRWTSRRRSTDTISRRGSRGGVPEPEPAAASPVDHALGIDSPELQDGSRGSGRSRRRDQARSGDFYRCCRSSSTSRISTCRIGRPGWMPSPKA